MLHAKTWMNEGKFETVLVNRNFNPFVAVGHFHIETGSAASNSMKQQPPMVHFSVSDRKSRVT